MLIKLYDENPSEKQIRQIVGCLKNGGIIIYPTDTIYGIGCDIFQTKAIERIAKLKNVDSKKNNFSIICYDLSHLSDYARPFENHIFRTIKKALPGPYTFILNANNKVPKIFENRKNTIGIRIPNNNIILQIVKELGHPILTSSLPEGEYDYPTDPELIHDEFGHLVDIVIDGGDGGNIPSTIIDCTGDNFEIIRQGKGETEHLF